jgi:hypothetical protein
MRVSVKGKLEIFLGKFKNIYKFFQHGIFKFI